MLELGNIIPIVKRRDSRKIIMSLFDVIFMSLFDVIFLITRTFLETTWEITKLIQAM